MKLSCPQKRGERAGFTLVELLVVITIVAVLAALGFTIGPKMLNRAKAAEALQNIRQIAPVMATYASEHSMRLPAILGDVVESDGTVVTRQWNEVLLAMMYPDVEDTAVFRSKEWWNQNDVFLRNPLLKESATPIGWGPLYPGYAMNQMLAENIAVAKGDPVPSEEELLKTVIPMAVLSDTSRTPLIAPCDNYFYRYEPGDINGFSNGTLKELLSEGKFPVLFVDGHVESMTPNEYVSRELYRVPLDPEP